jgi:hypothetical protein
LQEEATLDRLAAANNRAWLYPLRKKSSEGGALKGHDRGTLWVACRKRQKIEAGFSP